MGILLFYDGDGRIAGDIPKQHWLEMRRILPFVFDWLNSHMRHPPKTIPTALTIGPFKLARMMRDDADKTEEINLVELAEWKRFFAWCDFLALQDDTFKFFSPVVQLLREQSRHPDEARQA